MAGKKKKLRGSSLALIIISIVMAVIFAAVLITNIFIPVRYIAAYFVKSERAPEGELRVTFVDVGFGECEIIQLPDGKSLLIDSGSGSFESNSAIFKCLNECGIDTPDYAIMTSVRFEHCGGLKEISQYKPAARVYAPTLKNTLITASYGDYMRYASEKGIVPETPEVGEVVCGENYFFAFLSPQSLASGKSEYEELDKRPTEDNINAASAVIYLEYGGIAFLFTSDARAATLNAIANDYEIRKQLGMDYAVGNGAYRREVRLENCVVVSVAGHGSKACLSTKLYEILNAEYAVISMGGNFNELPTVEALSAASSYSQEVLMTGRDGNITFSVRSGNLTKI